jgi:hypothetical protein
MKQLKNIEATRDRTNQIWFGMGGAFDHQSELSKQCKNLNDSLMIDHSSILHCRMNEQIRTYEFNDRPGLRSEN